MNAARDRLTKEPPYDRTAARRRRISMQADVRLSPGGDHFVAEVDGRQAGKLELIRRDGVIVYPHTKVQPEYEGRGVGAALVRTALDAARAENAKVVPLCWFVQEWIDRHPDYADLVQDA
ncbi:GNAT family N-acetyltransferase [Streptosporangium sp. NPDC048865]|uniref:GNAT family N-acetyltransferase n=1 Tax=Streptosporangium sp. NPDC048865 TaxID=3155766 RepID=UPI0034380F0A